MCALMVNDKSRDSKVLSRDVLIPNKNATPNRLLKLNVRAEECINM